MTANNAPRILVVEDEPAIAALLTYNLEAEGYVVHCVEGGDDAETALAETPPDLLLLDWMLPGVSGLELCRRLRARPATKDMPVIMLTARGEEAERVRGLSVGADDYIVKPFSVPELLARVRALLRRAAPGKIANLLAAGDLELDRDMRRVRRAGRDIHLGPTEFRLLEFLMEKPGRVFARSHLLDRVWGQDAEIDERTVDVHMSAACARPCRAPARKTRSAPCAAPATRSTRPSGNRRGSSAEPSAPFSPRGRRWRVAPDEGDRGTRIPDRSPLRDFCAVARKRNATPARRADYWSCRPCRTARRRR
jgi:two-component system phosphate regulon response regulator PhoB